MGTIISEQECAIQAIIASEKVRPGCNLERLKYADWLEENGEPERAEFIRLGCRSSDLTQGERVHLAALAHTNKTSWFGIPRDWELRVFGDLPNGVRLGGALVQRGFVHSVRVPTLETWRGGACGRCGGSGEIGEWIGDNIQSPVDYVQDECPVCRGGGRISGIGFEIARWNPVQEVRVRNKEPSLGNVWHNAYFYRPDDDPQRNIPAPLFEIMESFGKHISSVPGCLLKYATTDDANHYWSKALIQEARQSASRDSEK